MSFHEMSDKYAQKCKPRSEKLLKNLNKIKFYQAFGRSFWRIHQKMVSIIHQ